MRMPRSRNGLQEVHIAILGMNGVGKSALTVKYITRRFITEYDPNLEDTYCKHEVISGKEYMLWIMDTVEATSKDPARYLSWADVFLVVYSVTSMQSLQYAEELLRQMSQQESTLTLREHVKCVVGTKCDLERYRQVNASIGRQLAESYGACFYETNSTEQYALVKPIFHDCITQVISKRARAVQSQSKRSPSPRNYSSDSEMQTRRKPPTSPMITSLVMRRTKSPAPTKSTAAAAADALKSSHSGAGLSATLPAGHGQQQPHLVPDRHHELPVKKSSPGLKLFNLLTGNKNAND